ncbi:MAG: hypothetical protein IIA87_04450 [Nanoarchaeota archaeon]|nr:hypothetical protein [Nanoarchaeota archaeon]
MDDKKFNKLYEELRAIKSLLVLNLQNAGIESKAIAKALGMSAGRLSQIHATKKYKKKNG